MLSLSLRYCLLVAGLALFTTAQAREARRVDGNPDLYERVLTLPGAAMHKPTGKGFEPAGAGPVPVLTPYYVYSRRSDDTGEWVEVAQRPKGEADGWVQASALETWRSQLVMQYMPRGKRQRVMFYADKDLLLEALAAEAGAKKAGETIAGIEARPDEAPEGIIAIEPWEAVDQQQSMYLMPILDFKKSSFGRSYGDAAGTRTTLVQVAGLNLDTVAAPANTKLPSPAPSTAPPVAKDESLQDFKVGIVFVMDTTASMGPYIQRTYDTVETIYGQLERSGDLQRVSFGLVGYRDNMDHNAKIEYVTRVFQPLSPNADSGETLDNLKRVKPATASTRDWYEDAYAGIRVAVQEMNWGPFGLKFVVLVSDAGARPAGHPLGTVSEAGLEAVRAEAQRNGIVLTTLHLLTAEGRNAGDHASAAKRYQKDLAGTGDANEKKYVPIAQGSVEEFTRQITSFASALQSSIASASEGRVVQKPPAAEGKANEGPDLGEILLNEIFRAQLEYLGRERGTEAPRFYRAWTADRDLTAPRNEALDVSVLLTKDQLNTLGSRLGDILLAFKAMELDASEGWAQLVALSGRLATDPGRGDFVEISDSGVLPGYLNDLPYKSKMLEMKLDKWVHMGNTAQHQLIKEIENRLMMYRDLAQDDRIWLDLGAGDPNLNVFPIPLSQLP